MNTAVSQARVLRDKISLCGGELDAEAGRFWRHPHFADVYRTHLCYTHAIIRATVPLLNTAAERFRSSDYAERPAFAALVEYLLRHAKEETGHDEWTVRDAQALGMSREEVIGWHPPLSVMHLVGTQYYWIHHQNPLAMLGYIAVMEGTPATPEFFEEVAARNSLPMEAISSLVTHAKIDPTHVADLDAMIDQLALTPEEAGVVGLSAIRTLGQLTVILREINESATP